MIRELSIEKIALFNFFNSHIPTVNYVSQLQYIRMYPEWEKRTVTFRRYNTSQQGRTEKQIVIEKSTFLEARENDSDFFLKIS